MRRLALAVMSLAGFALACGGGSGSGGGGGYGGGGGTANPPPACSASTATATTSMSMSGMAFVPSCAKITAGQTITFQNADMVTHTVTADAGQTETFDSGFVAPTQEFTHTFAGAETVHIHCKIHGMTATVIVQ